MTDRNVIRHIRALLLLAKNEIVAEEKRTSEMGGHSLYSQDPDRHLIEVAIVNGLCTFP
jgi:IS4 transposase